MKRINPVRLLFKALILMAVIDLSCGFSRPPAGRPSIYNWLVPGLTRFPSGNTAQPNNGSYNVAINEDINSMFASHVISGRPKASGEYRIIALGDSSIWGWGISSTDTVVEQINHLSLMTCRGQAVRAYNFALPGSLALRDAILLQQSRIFEPDLYLWFVTIHSFIDRSGEIEYMNEQPELSLAFLQNYRLGLPLSDIHRPSFWDGTLVGSRRTIKKLVLNQANGMAWAATGIDFYGVDAQGVSAELAADRSLRDYPSITNQEQLVESMRFAYLDAGRAEAGQVPVLVVNEPINRMSGKNSDVRYNRAYPRWVYDDYRLAFSKAMQISHMPYLDLWDALPEDEFVQSSSLHALPEGERMLAERLAPAILEIACP